MYYLLLDSRIEGEYATHEAAEEAAYTVIEELRHEAARSGEWPDHADVKIVEVVNHWFPQEVEEGSYDMLDGVGS